MTELSVGDVVQLSPDTSNEMFAACFMTVTELKPWGAQGYVRVPGGGDAYSPKGAYEVLRMRHVERRDPLIVHDRDDATEHYTTWGNSARELAKFMRRRRVEGDGE